jgi:type IV secretory pathway VirB4 component
MAQSPSPISPPDNTNVAAAAAQGKVIKPPKKSKEAASTQNTLLISEIRDGMVIMRDGSLRAVVMCQSINFDLMSPAEREAVEYAYQGFLNSLYFPVQVYIRSKRVNLDTYIEKLEKLHTSQDNILLGLLMEDYIAYIKYLVEAANIMDKQFYVVIPYYPSLLSQGGISTNVHKITTLVKPTQNTVVINEGDFNKYKAELTEQVLVVINGLQQMGVQAVPLNTQELIELYYNVYNPQTAANEHLTDINELEEPIVQKGQGEPPSRREG